MIYEGVNFDEAAVGAMTRDDFETMHIDTLWPDRDAATRKKMLAQVYGMIVKPEKKATKK